MKSVNLKELERQLKSAKEIEKRLDKVFLLQKKQHKKSLNAQFSLMLFATAIALTVILIGFVFYEYYESESIPTTVIKKNIVEYQSDEILLNGVRCELTPMNQHQLMLECS